MASSKKRKAEHLDDLNRTEKKKRKRSKKSKESKESKPFVAVFQHKSFDGTQTHLRSNFKSREKAIRFLVKKAIPVLRQRPACTLEDGKGARMRAAVGFSVAYAEIQKELDKKKQKTKAPFDETDWRSQLVSSVSSYLKTNGWPSLIYIDES